MFGLEILDIVIGLTFVYLLLSLLATALNEYVAALLNLRGKELARGLGRLLDDLDDRESVKRALDGVGSGTAATATLTGRFYAHRLIRPLATRRGWLFHRFNKEPRLPSYVPARTFAMALLDVLGYRDTTADDPTPAGGAQSEALVEIMKILKRESPLDVGQLEGLLAGANLPPALMPLLLEAFTGAQNPLRHLHDSVEVWFNNAMDRVSGAYKRTAQGWLFVLGLIVATCSNADTVDMWRRLASNDELREAMAERAVGRLPALERRVHGRAPAPAATGSPAPAGTSPAAPAGASAPDTATADAATAETTSADTTSAETAKTDATTAAKAAAEPRTPADSAWEAYQVAKSELDSMELKLGWTARQLQDAGLLKSGSNDVDWWPFDSGGFWVKLLGLLLTAVAISLGAPFWFDVLNKVISIRAAGRSPEEKPKSPEGGPKRPAEHTPK